MIFHESAKMGLSMVTAESGLHHVPEFTKNLYVVEKGQIIYAGKPGEVQNEGAVMRIIGRSAGAEEASGT